MDIFLSAQACQWEAFTTYSEVKPIHMPETLNEKAVLLREVALLRKLGGSFWRSATVFEDVVDQRLFVMNIEFGRHDKVEQ